MPNGYSFLDTTSKRTHSWDRWVIHTGQPTSESDLDGAYREPTVSESLLIDLVLKRVSIDNVPLMPEKSLNTIKFCEALKAEGAFIWTREATGGISASVYESDGDQIRWVDAIPALAGAERESTFVIVLATSLLGAGRRRRTLFSVETRLAVRQVVDTVITVPTVRRWGGSFDEKALEDTASLVRETVCRSLVDGCVLTGSVPTDVERCSAGLWTELVDTTRLRGEPAYYEEITSDVQ